MKKTNVLIVEDHALTRFALLTSLKDEDFTGEIFEADNAKCAYNILSQNNVDVILMDIGLPDINGIRASKKIKSEYPDIKIIIVTSHADEKEVLECLDAGVNAYCSKDIAPNKLISVIKDVNEGAVWFDPAVSNIVLKRNSSPKLQNEVKNKYNLTAKELNALSLLADGNSNNEIAKKMNISINTTKVHMCSILQKLSVDDRTQAAIKAIRENLI